MTISINSNAKAKQETASKNAGAHHGVRHHKKSSRVSHYLAKAKNGWIGAALLPAGWYSSPDRRTVLSR
jgi:hypothetical protein